MSIYDQFLAEKQGKTTVVEPSKESLLTKATRLVLPQFLEEKLLPKKTNITEPPKSIYEQFQQEKGILPMETVEKPKSFFDYLPGEILMTTAKMLGYEEGALTGLKEATPGQNWLQRTVAIAKEIPSSVLQIGKEFIKAPLRIAATIVEPWVNTAVGLDPVETEPIKLPGLGEVPTMFYSYQQARKSGLSPLVSGILAGSGTAMDLAITAGFGKYFSEKIPVKVNSGEIVSTVKPDGSVKMNFGKTLKNTKPIMKEAKYWKVGEKGLLEMIPTEGKTIKVTGYNISQSKFEYQLSQIGRALKKIGITYTQQTPEIRNITIPKNLLKLPEGKAPTMPFVPKKPTIITPPPPIIPRVPISKPVVPSTRITRIEMSAKTIDRVLSGQERLRVSPKGRELLAQQLRKQEAMSPDIRLDKQINRIIKAIFVKPAIQRTSTEMEITNKAEDIKKAFEEVKPEVKPILKEISPLIQEAKKYKSAEKKGIKEIKPTEITEMKLRAQLSPKMFTDEQLLEEKNYLEKQLDDETKSDEELDEIETRLDLVNAELEKTGAIVPPTEEIIKFVPEEAFEPVTDKDYKKGFKAEGRGEAKFDNNNQVFHSTETKIEIPNPETKGRISALKQPLTQFGYVINLIRAGKTVPAEIRYVIDDYNDQSRQQIGEDIIEDLGNGKYKLIFSDEGLNEESLDDFFAPESYKGITDYTKLQEGYGIEIGDFKENDVVKFKDDTGERFGRLIDIFDNGRAIVETSMGEVEIKMWSLKKPTILTKEQEKIAEGVFPVEKIQTDFELTADFMEKKGIKPITKIEKKAKIVPKRNINSKIFDIVKIATSKRNLPILGKIAIRDGKVIASDLKINIVYDIGKKIGNILLDPSALKGKSIDEVQIDEKNLTVKIGAIEVKGESTEEFPLSPDVNVKPQLEVSSDILVDSFNKALQSVSDNQIRPEIGSLFIKSENGKLRIVSSDSFRLTQLYAGAIISQDFEMMIPYKSAEKLVKILNQVKPDNISIAIDNKNNLVKFKFGQFSVVSRLIEDEFPDYKKIIPLEVKNQLIIDREDFLLALSEAPETKTMNVEITLDQTNKKIILSKKTEKISFKKELSVRFIEKPKAKSPDETLYVLMPIQGRGIGYNIKFLQDFLKKSKAAEVEFSNLSESAPAILKDFSLTMANLVRETQAKYNSATLESLKTKPEFRKSQVRLKLKKIGVFSTNKMKIKSANDVADIFSELKRETREKIFILNLDKDNKIINAGLVSIGTLNSAIVHSRDILQESLFSKAKKIYFIHNHPSGNVEVSENDLTMLQRIKSVLGNSGIELAGAVIINHTEYGFLDADLGFKTVKYFPRVKKGKEISLIEMEQIIESNDNFVMERKPVKKPKDIVNFFSSIISPDIPTVVLINLNSRNQVNGYEIIGSSFKDKKAILKKINKSISVHNAASVILGSNIRDISIGWEVSESLKIIGVELFDIVVMEKDGTFTSYKTINQLSGYNNRVRENVANYGEFSPEEQEVIRVIQEGLPIPIELTDAVKSLQEKGVIQSAKGRKEPKPLREKKVKPEKAPLQSLKIGERISRRGITISHSRTFEKRPYLLSYKTGNKKILKTFENYDEARRRFDFIVDLRTKGARTRGELPEEVQSTKEQKIIAYQIAYQKKITPIQYKRLAMAYAGADSMVKMTPEQAEKFIEALKAIKPKFGKKISIPKTKALVTQEEAEAKFKNITIGWLLDIFKTPANVFRKIGVERQTKAIFEGFQLQRDFTNKWFSQFKKWQQELDIRDGLLFRKGKMKEQSARLFRAINNPDEEIKLSEKEGLIVERARRLTDEVADLVDDSRAEMGLEPMKRRENYITNLLTDEAYFLLQKTHQMPNELYAMLTMRIPASIFDRLLFERKGGLPIKEDFWQALKAMVQIHGKYIHLNPPVYRFERFMRFYGNKVPQLSRIYIRSRINRFLNRPGIIDIWLKKIDENINNAISHIPGLRKKVEIEWQDGLTEIIEMPRILIKPAQKSLRLLKSVKYTYDLAFSLSFYTINLTQFWLNTIPKLRGNFINTYQAAFAGYAQMLMDFFRPSKWEYWRQRGVLTEIDNVIDQEYRMKSGGDILNLFAKLSEFNNRVASALAVEKNLQILMKNGKFGMFYKELASGFGEEAQNYARYIADMTQFRYGMEQKPIAFDNPIMDLYYQYNTFAIKQIEFVEKMLKNTELRKTISDYRQSRREGKTKEFVAELTQGPRGEFIRFIINAFILSLILNAGYVWDAVFKGIVPNQVEGMWKILKGLWTGDKSLRQEGYRLVLMPPSGNLIEKVADYGIIATIRNAKAIKQLSLIRAIITGEGELKTIAGKPTEKITRGVAEGRLLKSYREETALNNSKGWDLYSDSQRKYNNTRNKAIELIRDGKKEEAKKLARTYNEKARADLKKLIAMELTDLRLKEQIKKARTGFVISLDDFNRWVKDAK